mgnify:CR=1 FL=1
MANHNRLPITGNPSEAERRAMLGEFEAANEGALAAAFQEPGMTIEEYALMHDLGALIWANSYEKWLLNEALREAGIIIKEE